MSRVVECWNCKFLFSTMNAGRGVVCPRCGAKGPM